MCEFSSASNGAIVCSHWGRFDMAGLHLAETMIVHPHMDEWVTLHKSQEMGFASVSVIAMTKKGTVRTLKDSNCSLGFSTRQLTKVTTSFPGPVR